MDKLLIRELKIRRAYFKLLHLQKLLKQQNIDAANVFDNEAFKKGAINYALRARFMRFLEENNTSFETFSKEAEKQNKRIEYKYIFDIINSTLAWARTQQGREFWRDLHVKWGLFLIDNVLKNCVDKTQEKEFTSHFKWEWS